MLATWFLAFNHDRPAFKGPGQIPLKKAINFAIDRPELARTFGYLAGKRTDQMLPPALARPASIYPLGGADLVDRATLVRAGATSSRPSSSSTRQRSAGPSRSAQMLTFNLKQLGHRPRGEVLRRGAARREGRDPRRAVRPRPERLGRRLRRRAAFFVPLLNGATSGRRQRERQLFDDPATNARIEAANRLTGEARRKAWADLDVDLMRDNPPWAPLVHTRATAPSSPGASAASSTTRSTASTSRPRARSNSPSHGSPSTASSRAPSRSSEARASAPSSSARVAARSRYTVAPAASPLCAR